MERARSGEIGMRPSERRRRAEEEAAKNGGIAPGGGGYPDGFAGGRGGRGGGYDYAGGRGGGYQAGPGYGCAPLEPPPITTPCLLCVCPLLAALCCPVVRAEHAVCERITLPAVNEGNGTALQSCSACGFEAK